MIIVSNYLLHGMKLTFTLTRETVLRHLAKFLFVFWQTFGWIFLTIAFIRPFADFFMFVFIRFNGVMERS